MFVQAAVRVWPRCHRPSGSGCCPILSQALSCVFPRDGFLQAAAELHVSSAGAATAEQQPEPGLCPPA